MKFMLFFAVLTLLVAAFLLRTRRQRRLRRQVAR